MYARRSGTNGKFHGIGPFSLTAAAINIDAQVEYIVVLKEEWYTCGILLPVGRGRIYRGTAMEG